MSLRGIVLLLVLLPSLPFCLLRPFYGIALWTIIAFTSLQWYTWSAYAVPWAMVVAIPTLAGFFIFTRGWSRLASRETVLLGVLWAWFCVTTIVSMNTPLFEHHAQDTWNHLIFVSKILLMTLVTTGIVDSFERLRKLTIVIAACFGFFVVKTLPFLVLTGGANRVYGPEKSMIADNNDFGLALNMTLPLFYFLARSESGVWGRRIFSALFVMTIPAIFFTYSRGALIGLVAIMGLLFIRSRQRKFLIPVVLIALIIAVVFAPEAWKQRMNPSGGLDKSALSRINAWTFSWRLANDYPIAGGGFNTFTQELFNRYAPNPADVHGPHSVYFGILAEHGFVGLFLYLSLVVSCLASTAKLARWARLQGDDLMRMYALMFQLSLVGFLMSGFFLGRQYFDYFYSIIACIISLKKIAAARWSEDGEPADDEGLEDSEMAEAV